MATWGETQKVKSYIVHDELFFILWKQHLNTADLLELN